MKVFIIGVSGAVGRLLARNLTDRGDIVSGLVRRDDQRVQLAALGPDVRMGELAELTADSLAPMLSGFDAIVYAAGSNGGAREVTAAIDGEGGVTALEASRLAGVNRFALVSVLPEAGRGQHIDDDEEFYFAVKKLADVTVSESDLDWLILRPSMLVDRAGVGTVSLGPPRSRDQRALHDHRSAGDRTRTGHGDLSRSTHWRCCTTGWVTALPRVKGRNGTLVPARSTRSWDAIVASRPRVINAMMAVQIERNT